MKQAGTSTTFNLTINSSSTFTMHFSKPELFNNEKAACVPKDNQTRKPETWTITKGEHEGKRLLVFSLLRQNATFKYVSGQRSGHPNGPDCELFVRFVSFYPFFKTFLIITFFVGCKRLQATPCQPSYNNVNDYFDDHRGSINGNIRAA